jgi:hypothetical protein
MIAARKASVAGRPRRLRRRHNGTAALANPSRRRRRRRRNVAMVRSNARTNPRRISRRERRRRRRHNPGGAMMGTVGLIFKSSIPAALAGGAFGMIDAKLLDDSSPIVRVGAKIGAAALAGLLLRKRPIAAASTIGAIIGSASYSGALTLAGGVSAPSPAAAVKGMGLILRTDKRAMGLLVQQMNGLGLQVLNASPKLGAVAGQGARLAPAPGGQVVGSVNLG